MASAIALAATVAAPAGSASAASTVAAQLTLSGVATSSSPTGGTTVGVHPGDSVQLTASNVPTAGLPGVLSSIASDVFNSVLGVEVDVSGLPGQNGVVRLSSPLLGIAGTTACAGTVPKITLPALKSGTYNFTYSIKTATVLPGILGCKAGLDLTGAQLKALTSNGVAVDATNTYHGVIVSSNDPPKGGISIQLPGVTVSGHVGPVALPSVSLPGVSLPTISLGLPSVVPSLSTSTAQSPTRAAAAGKQAVSGSGLEQSLDYAGIALTVPQMVVPHSAGGYVPSTGLGTDGSANTLTGTDLPGSNAVQYVQALAASPASAGGGGVHSLKGGAIDLRYAATSGARTSSTSLVPLVMVLGGVLVVLLGCGFTTRRVLARLTRD